MRIDQRRAHAASDCEVLRRLTACAALALALIAPTLCSAEVLIRWDQPEVPSSASLGIATLVIPAENSGAAQNAVTRGYRVYLEVAARALSTFSPPAEGFAGVIVRGQASGEQLALLRARLGRRGRLITLDERGKWPHIRSNWVTRHGEVLQVSNRSAQPWIENNAALMRIVHTTASNGGTAAGGTPGPTAFMTYQWQSETQSELDDGPDTENYLVAIAEAGSFGGDLLLPLHQRFERDLLLGLPQAREAWQRIRQSMEFYSWGLPDQSVPVANIGVVTRDPQAWFEVMNLLSRHNLPFQLISPAGLTTELTASLDLLIVLDSPSAAQFSVLDGFAHRGGTLVLDRTGVAGTQAGSVSPWAALRPLVTSDERVSYKVGDGRVVEVRKGVADPDKFALEIRELLGAAHRSIDIWNGITVIAAAYKDPDGRSMRVHVLNYAHQPLPVQMRIAGTYSLVQYESPEERSTLLPYQHRDGFTEVVLPALRTGGRIFLSNGP
ncbi:MAG: hypothetical protein V7647_1546 [Acidobacteriota bacterium]